MQSAQEAQVLGHGFYTLTVRHKSGESCVGSLGRNEFARETSSWVGAMERALAALYGLGDRLASYWGVVCSYLMCLTHRVSSWVGFLFFRYPTKFTEWKANLGGTV